MIGIVRLLTDMPSCVGGHTVLVVDSSRTFGRHAHMHNRVTVVKAIATKRGLSNSPIVRREYTVLGARPCAHCDTLQPRRGNFVRTLTRPASASCCAGVVVGLSGHHVTFMPHACVPRTVCEPAEQIEPVQFATPDWSVRLSHHLVGMWSDTSIRSPGRCKL